MFPQINNIILIAEKSFFVLGAIFYLVFALIIVKQTTMMSKNVSDKFNSILISFSYLHLLFSILLVFLTLVLL
jgi:hypothetical protein